MALATIPEIVGLIPTLDKCLCDDQDYWPFLFIPISNSCECNIVIKNKLGTFVVENKQRGTAFIKNSGLPLHIYVSITIPLK